MSFGGILLYLFLSLVSAADGSRCTNLFGELQVRYNLNKNDLIKSLESASAKEVFSELMKEPTLKDLLTTNVGETESYSLYDHSLQVLKNFDQQVSQYQAIYPSRLSSEVLPIMRLIVALHDIGKPIAIAKGNRDLQHVETMIIIDSLFRRMKLGEESIKLAEALVNHDDLGSFAQQKLTLNELMSQLQNHASISGLRYPVYLRWQYLFFTSDAGAYHRHRESNFVQVDNMLRIRGLSEMHYLHQIVFR